MRATADGQDCESRFAAWLYRLAYHRAIEHRRAARIRFQHISLCDQELPTSSTETEAARQELVTRLLEGLPDLYRSVLNLHYWLDCSVEEIVDLLCVAPGTVKSYLFRARATAARTGGSSRRRACEVDDAYVH